MQAICVGIKHLGRSPTVVFCVSSQEIGNALGTVASELESAEVHGVLFDIRSLYGIGVPGVVQEKLNGVLHGFEVAHVEDPELTHAVGVAEFHLFPDAFYLTNVEPLIVARVANVVNMVVHAVASASGFVGKVGQTADVAPVVVAEEEGYVVGDLHALVVIVLHLFV